MALRTRANPGPSPLPALYLWRFRLRLPAGDFRAAMQFINKLEQKQLDVVDMHGCIGDPGLIRLVRDHHRHYQHRFFKNAELRGHLQAEQDKA